MGVSRITSSSNPVIKEVRALADKKDRSDVGACILEGSRLIDEAVSYHVAIRYFVVSEEFESRFMALSERLQDVNAYIIPDDLFRRISATETPQGILAVAALPSYDEDILNRLERFVILENLQDPGNMGTIIRTADACGFDGILLSKGCTDPYNPKVLRSTMGSVFHIPVIACADIYDTISKLKKNNVRILAAHPRDAVTVWNSNMAGRIAIVIGNEGNGLTDRMLSATDTRVMIPMPGKAESFNAASAAAILLYESMRQKMSHGEKG